MDGTESVLPLKIDMSRYKAYAIKTEKSAYQVNLTDEERQEAQEELLNMLESIELVKQKAKEVADRFKKELKDYLVKQKAAQEALGRGYWEREGLKYTIIFIEERRAGVYSEDGRLISDRPLSVSERQLDLVVESSRMERFIGGGSRYMDAKIERVNTGDDIPEIGDDFGSNDIDWNKTN